jgi:xanthine dehydrogenase YagR molybdenum-binding subunit
VGRGELVLGSVSRVRRAPQDIARGGEGRRALAATRARCSERDGVERPARDRRCLRDADRHPHPELSSGVEAIGSITSFWDDPTYKAYSLASYGAHFAEVRVDTQTGEIRITRMLGVFGAGRILNQKTARSQLIGDMLWGASAALMEEGVVDPRFGSFINRDFANYLVPVHADIPEIDAITLDGIDGKANELGAKGIGELGICGSGAAIANAVLNATGIRVREFPITIEKLLPGLAGG